MLSVAANRITRVVEGDAAELPFSSDSFDCVLAVWAVHVIGDFDGLIREVRRGLRAGGKFLVVSPTPDVESNDLTDIAFRFGPILGKGWDRSAELAPRLSVHGLRHEGDHETDHYEFEESPNDRASAIERRDFSSLWDLDDETWDRVIQPVIDDLRALPDPDRSRACTHRHILSVYS